MPAPKRVGDEKNGRFELDLRHIDALLRFHFHIEPEKLSDEDWAARWAELRFALEFQNGTSWTTR